MIDRREFVAGSSLIAGSAALNSISKIIPEAVLREADHSEADHPEADHYDWEAIRSQFNVDRNFIHMAALFLASHPKPVRDAIEMHRRGLDASPLIYTNENIGKYERDIRAASAAYFGGTADDFAMTDSTTMGLGTVYCGIKLLQGHEILTTEHDHLSTRESVRLASLRTGASVRVISLYKNIATVTEDEVVDSIIGNIQPHTRVIAITWVQSDTGLKIPIGRIADAVAELNSRRDEADHALLCVDGVHGFGVEDATIADLRCDFFIAGCHKWIFGPRGTGLIYGNKKAWNSVVATIPSFDAMWRVPGRESKPMWREAHLAAQPASGWPLSANMSPGGFHSFEHRWALGEAFRFHHWIGKARVAARIHQLNRQCKEGLARMPHVTLYTPMSDRLSAGMVCFDIQGMKQVEVLARLLEMKVIGSETPYQNSYPRFSPSLLNNEEEVEKTLRAVRALAG